MKEYDEEFLKYLIYNICRSEKRKWLSAFDNIDYRYRRSDKEEKVKFLQEEYYKYVTEQDIQEALNKAYESLKPVFSLELFQK